MPKTVILAAARTPIGKMGGGLSTLDATELAVSRSTRRSSEPTSTLRRSSTSWSGRCFRPGRARSPRARRRSSRDPKDVSSETINKVCASGLRASVMLDQAIRAGDLDVGVAPAWSRCRWLRTCSERTFRYRMGDAKMLDAMVHDGLTNPFSGKQMFVEATESGTSSRSRARTSTAGRFARTSSP